MHVLFCSVCRAEFPAKRVDKLYCSFRCQSRAGRLRRGEQTDTMRAGRDCRICRTHFPVAPPDTNRRYCSEPCAMAAAKNSRNRFHKRNPRIQSIYNSRRPFKDSGVVIRVRRKHPDLPQSCQACGESRVLELAHKPGFERNGAWRKMENTKPHMILILCPTCHKLLDKGICTPEELRLT